MSIYLRVPNSDARIEFGTVTHAAELVRVVVKAIEDRTIVQFINGYDALVVNFGELAWAEVVADPTPHTDARTYQASLGHF